MKQYLLSILYLLAALALPATAQTSPQTKAAPDAPVMPYVVTVNEPTSGETAKKLSVRSEYPTSSYIIYKDGKAENGGVAYNTKEVKFDIATLPQGYFPAEGFPKVYETNAPNTAVSLTFANGVYTFTMPAKPVTIEVKYIKTDDLDLATLTEKATLTFKDSKWTYKVGTGGTPTLFTGTVKGKGTHNLKITSDDNKALTLANGTELTGNIEVVTDYTYLSLHVEKAGTATVKGNITATDGRLRCNGSGRLNIYGTVTGDASHIENLMQWTWKTAPTSGKAITIITPLEQLLTTFTADGAHTTFATNFPNNTSIKVKVDGKTQKDDKGATTFTMSSFGYLTSFTGMEDSNLDPVKDPDGITITSENKYKPGTDDKGTEADFSGTITGDVSTIKVDAAVDDNPVIILNEVKKKDDKDNTVVVAKDASVTLALKGTANEVSTMTVAAGGTLTLTTVVGGGSFTTPPTIKNAGVFISETRLIKKVEGDAPLEVTGEPVGKEIAPNEPYILKVEANIPESTPTKATTRSSGTPTLSYRWQSYTPETNAWTNITDDADGSTYTTSQVGTYRCAVTSKNGDATTTLTTQAAEVKLKSDPGPGPDPVPDPDPTPTPTFYTVTLPTLVGATTDPAAGTYNVEAWGSFVFTLTLSKDYDQSKPVVKTSRGETITPRATDGKYVVNAVREDITIQITDIMSNIPTGIAGTETGDRIWATAGQLCIHTDSPKDVHIYNFSGQLQKVANALYGDTNLPLPAGNYVVVIGSRSYKVQVSR